MLAWGPNSHPGPFRRTVLPAWPYRRRFFPSRFFMRGFPDLASREPMKARFYESTLWKEEL
jgi:hypothetical protein